ncbi:MAG: hypothetical protein JRI26_04310 [Deltaproteobacteria bacterium]|nr:hypothetical protein [Deltaproteobacteria bacterium]
MAWAGQTDLDMLVVKPTIDDSYSLKLQNRDGTDKFTVDYNGVQSAIAGSKRTPVVLSFVAGAGYTLTGPSQGSLFLIAPADTDEPYEGISSTGVTVVIPSPSSSNLGWEPTIINTSGTSTMVIYIDGVKTIGASGTTNILTYDAEGDSVTLGYYESAGSGISVYVKCDIVDGT